VKSPNETNNLYQQIFAENWEAFKKEYPVYATEYYNECVFKMLNCGQEGGGYKEYGCWDCGLGMKRVCFSCGSKFCLSCAITYTEKAQEQISKSLISGLTYRHATMTLPEQLRNIFHRNRHDGEYLSKLMRCVYDFLEDVTNTVKKVKNKNLKIGVIAFVHTGGRSGSCNPHIHVIWTDGGYDEQTGIWRDLGYFPYKKILPEKWQYHLLTFMKKLVPTQEMKDLVNELWNDYPKGLVANISKSIVPRSYKALTGYLSKYLSSPPIAIRRITGYQDGSVSYYYKDHRTKKRKYVTVTVFTFMGRMLQQILPKGFQRIRYFGIQAKCVFNKWKAKLLQVLTAMGCKIDDSYQTVFRKNYRERYKKGAGIDPFICKECGSELCLMRVWIPGRGIVYDALEEAKKGKYGFDVPINVVAEKEHYQQQLFGFDLEYNLAYTW